MNPKRKRKKSVRKSRRSYRRNPAKTVADPHGARELALCYDNERAQQGQKESIINNLARKMAKGAYDKSKAVKLWEYAAMSGAQAYAKTFGSHGDTGTTMFNAATRRMAAEILESENRDYVRERSERFAPKPKHKKNPAPSRYTQRLRRRTSSGAKPTVSAIKAATEASGGHYFDKATMKYFGNRMSDFKVFVSSRSGRVFIGAPSRSRRGYYSLHEFKGHSLRSADGSPAHWEDVKEWVNRQ